MLGSHVHKPTPCYCPTNGAEPMGQKVSFLLLCYYQTTVWWYPSSQMALYLSSTLTNIQAHSSKLLYTQTANHHIQWATSFLEVWRISLKFCPAKWKYYQTHTTKGRRRIKGTPYSYWLWLPPWENVNKPMNFIQSAIMVTQLQSHQLFRNQNQPIQRFSFNVTTCYVIVFPAISLVRARSLMCYLYIRRSHFVALKYSFKHWFWVLC